MCEKESNVQSLVPGLVLGSEKRADLGSRRTEFRTTQEIKEESQSLGYPSNST